MALLVYLILLIFSLAGAFLIFRKHLVQAKRLSPEELLAKLEASRSVRSELKERWYDPLEARFYESLAPAFWRVSEKFVIRARMLVLKLETRLKWLSDNIRGRHIKLEVSSKSEYWQNLNGAKNNARLDEKKEEVTPP